MPWIPDTKICTLCNRLRIPPTHHGISKADAEALGSKRCRMCGKAATVRCVLGQGDFFVECEEGHLSRTP
jgi:hypothetical protein